MKQFRRTLLSASIQALVTGLLLVPASSVLAQDNTTELSRVEVTGSRIKKTAIEGQAPVFTIDRQDIEKSGLSSVGDILLELTTGGKALNSKFNSSGNFGFPADGGGIGAGSSQVDLRHLESKRVLVLVDGIRWVNDSSASGVGGSVDLNTIPLAIVERIEVLEDGASAIYGSDAIAGVVNIITRRDFQGAEISTYYGEYDEGDGETTKAEFTIGGGNEKFQGTFSVSYFDQERVSAADRDISRLPIPIADGLAFGSSRNPEGRFTFCDPRITPLCAPDDFIDITLNPGTGTPIYNPNNPTGGTSTFHNFGGADRFNYSPFNLVITPSERKSIFANVRYQLSDATSWYAKALYNNRESVNQAAPEPIVLGPFNGTGTLSDRIFISRLNPYNPFGIDLDPNFNFGNIGRRPLEGGPRVFVQDVDTWYFNTGLEGSFDIGDRMFFWDVNYVSSENKANQTFYNGYNLRRMQLALGDPAICAQNPGCVPLNLFGGQGANGQGTITPEMLNWIRMVTKDSSEQDLEVLSANLTGDLAEIWAGPLAFATGFEHREIAGKFLPDQVRLNGESQDSAAIVTQGDYDVDEVYAEFNVPLLSEAMAAKRLDLSLALRYSDYSNFGSESTGKIGLRWQPVDDLVLRGTYAEGFRAPFIGELFGQAQFGASITDPCGPVNGPLVVDDSNGPNSTPLETNCRALGVPSGYRAVDTQITTTTGGNANLQPENADSFTVGMVYSPSWAEDTSFSQRMDFEVTYYDHEIEGAIQAPDAQDILNACVASGSPSSAFCQGITRNPSGNINRFNNLLANIGVIETDGYDVKMNWTLPDFSWGTVKIGWDNTFVNEYRATDIFGNEFTRAEGVEVNDSAIPEWQSNVQVDWRKGDWSAGWTVRYIDDVSENCSDFVGLNECSDEAGARNELDATTYHDLQVGWSQPMGTEGLNLVFGINNVSDEDPPPCFTCSLNGYDAGTYDAPGRFYYVQASYKFD